MADWLNDVVDVIEQVANTEAAEYVYKALDVLSPLLPQPAAGTVSALVKVSRGLAANDEARKKEIAAILADYQVRAQDVADKFDH